MRKTVCFYQVFRRPKFVREGVGDCKICTADEKNKECAEFLPMTLYSFQAKEADDGKKAEVPLKKVLQKPTGKEVLLHQAQAHQSCQSEPASNRRNEGLNRPSGRLLKSPHSILTQLNKVLALQVNWVGAEWVVEL